VKITIEKDGRISNVSLLTSSGQSEFDRSIMAAAQRVGRIREPLPEGMEGHVSIRFRLQD
jgi:TonB family protein